MTKRNISEATRQKNREREVLRRAKQTPEERETAKLYQQKYKQENVEKIKELNRAYHAAHREKQNAYRRQWGKDHPGHQTEWARANPDKVKNSWLKFHYGITLEQYNVMLSIQDNKCAICGTTEPLGKGNFHVDHNHETGRVRGLLCHHCNTSLGAFDDSIDILQKAIDYLKLYLT